MNKWLLNTKKIKFTVSTWFTNDTEETELCTNEADTSSVFSTILMEQLLKNDDERFPKYWTKDLWHDKFNTYEWLTINRG
jgi:hypothetical protein